MDSVWGGVVAEIFRDPYSVGWQNRPYIRVIQTCIVFCPNNVDSLPEFMSTNCPNWGGAAAPLPPPSRTPMYTGVLRKTQKRLQHLRNINFDKQIDEFGQLGPT